mmetsp:Transcript_22374/g.53234  ORF Transcript_22374/g.53234 Transcript_22374/m.53234 type:complete len:267 (-) Transcript_22374:46-846(-)
MGGDDLGSDDEYFTAPLGGLDDYGESLSEDDVHDAQKKQREQSRKREQKGGVESNEGVPKKKSKKRGSPIEVLGSKIRLESAESKAQILSEFAGVDFYASHIAKISNKNKEYVNSNIESESFRERLLCLISKKQLKSKLQQRSPRAVIFCLSARRSVAILKDLAPMRLRIAKLFPKQGTIGDQARQLESTEFSLVVGTPHRIKELIDRKSLTLKNTQLLCLDTFLNSKNQSVYTLHDTSPFLKAILKDHAQPVCNMNGKKLKIGLV